MSKSERRAKEKLEEALIGKGKAAIHTSSSSGPTSSSLSKIYNSSTTASRVREKILGEIVKTETVYIRQLQQCKEMCDEYSQECWQKDDFQAFLKRNMASILMLQGETLGGQQQDPTNMLLQKQSFYSLCNALKAMYLFHSGIAATMEHRLEGLKPSSDKEKKNIGILRASTVASSLMKNVAQFRLYPSYITSMKTTIVSLNHIRDAHANCAPNPDAQHKVTVISSGEYGDGKMLLHVSELTDKLIQSIEKLLDAASIRLKTYVSFMSEIMELTSPEESEESEKMFEIYSEAIETFSDIQASLGVASRSHLQYTKLKEEEYARKHKSEKEIDDLKNQIDAITNKISEVSGPRAGLAKLSTGVAKEDADSSEKCPPNDTIHRFTTERFDDKPKAVKLNGSKNRKGGGSLYRSEILDSRSEEDASISEIGKEEEENDEMKYMSSYSERETIDEEEEFRLWKEQRKRRASSPSKRKGKGVEKSRDISSTNDYQASHHKDSYAKREGRMPYDNESGHEDYQHTQRTRNDTEGNRSFDQNTSTKPASSKRSKSPQKEPSPEDKYMMQDIPTMENTEEFISSHSDSDPLDDKNSRAAIKHFDSLSKLEGLIKVDSKASLSMTEYRYRKQVGKKLQTIVNGYKESLNQMRERNRTLGQRLRDSVKTTSQVIQSTSHSSSDLKNYVEDLKRELERRDLIIKSKDEENNALKEEMKSFIESEKKVTEKYHKLGSSYKETKKLLQYAERKYEAAVEDLLESNARYESLLEKNVNIQQEMEGMKDDLNMKNICEKNGYAFQHLQKVLYHKKGLETANKANLLVDSYNTTFKKPSATSTYAQNSKLHTAKNPDLTADIMLHYNQSINRNSTMNNESMVRSAIKQVNSEVHAHDDAFESGEGANEDMINKNKLIVAKLEKLAEGRLREINYLKEKLATSETETKRLKKKTMKLTNQIAQLEIRVVELDKHQNTMGTFNTEFERLSESGFGDSKAPSIASGKHSTTTKEILHNQQQVMKDQAVAIKEEQEVITSLKEELNEESKRASILLKTVEHYRAKLQKLVSGYMDMKSAYERQEQGLNFVLNYQNKNFLKSEGEKEKFLTWFAKKMDSSETNTFSYYSSSGKYTKLLNELQLTPIGSTEDMPVEVKSTEV
eukprot:Nk52_evm13s2496 gene=Nk52_evmTU13s2496